LSGGSSGWAGPPEGRPAAATAAAEEQDDDGAEMVRIDAETTGGLGGTTEEVLGPLVSTGTAVFWQQAYNLACVNSPETDTVCTERTHLPCHTNQAGTQ
jgi:hypothetical protein